MDKGEDLYGGSVAVYLTLGTKVRIYLTFGKAEDLAGGYLAVYLTPGKRARSWQLTL